ncbi:serine/threonine-protein kinase VRK1 isoform X1 [Pleurodeles waltl]|uniref:serine/threonine-protein kinase VRK1 isoform X1 n=1 Tax=Pleurodeles waltl TaxID=8319 RepID=UPI003709A476
MSEPQDQVAVNMLRKKAISAAKKSPAKAATKASVPAVKKTSTAKRAPTKRKLAEAFSLGEVLTDGAKKQWKLGAPVGQGGFGCLYLADENATSVVRQDAPYVVKVEPSDNGPLFTELKFYMRAAKPDEIQKWISANKLKYLGVPKYWGSGLHERNGSRYRFMVMDRFGKDLQKIYEESGKVFPQSVVLQLGLRLLDILEYIHEHEYVHGDIKASNLLLHYKNPDQVYLVDYGLAYRYCPGGVHKEYKEDPKRCHDGTIEYTSIDAHKGVAPSRRGDLEILGYCMVQWLCGQLPWEDNLNDPNYVRDCKISFRENIPEFMSKCFPFAKPDEIEKYMEAVKELDYSQKPPYQHLRDLLLQGLKSNGRSDDGKLSFASVSNGVSPRKSTPKKKTKTNEPIFEADPVVSESPAKKTTTAGPKKSPSRLRGGAATSAGKGKVNTSRGRGKKKL